mmetsp:Transcript_43718/g.71063  ORF Transcript_43718/g.71063 Transcript_43718/m.71063 type:complete len:222 (-) Transcript_43718:306-971(-)
MVHDLVFLAPFLRGIFARLGAFRGDRAIAAYILQNQRHDLFVLPGGDYEVFRPHTRAYQIEHAGRKGFAALALKTRTPVLPVAHAGSQNTLLVLARGDSFARLLRIDKWCRFGVFPIFLCCPWIIAVGPWPHFPVPATLRYKIGSVVPLPNDLKPGMEPSEIQVAEYAERVLNEQQRLLDALCSTRSRYETARFFAYYMLYIALAAGLVYRVFTNLRKNVR